jgi:hypothetical protein
MSFLTQHQLLTNCKRPFNPTHKNDIALLKQFLEENRWGESPQWLPCPFLLEKPYLTIPDMMMDKFVKNQLGLSWIG